MDVICSFLGILRPRDTCVCACVQERARQKKEETEMQTKDADGVVLIQAAMYSCRYRVCGDARQQKRSAFFSVPSLKTNSVVPKCVLYLLTHCIWQDSEYWGVFLCWRLTVKRETKMRAT